MNRIEIIKETLELGKKHDSKYSVTNDQVEWLMQRLERYEKALKFYADEQNYDKWTYNSEKVTNVTRDKGKVAMEALNEIT